MLEVTFQGLVIAKMAIAYHQQRAAWGERVTTLTEQAPGDLVANHLLLVEGRVAEDQIGAVCCSLAQAVADDKAGAACGKGRGKVVARRGNRSPGLIDKGDLRIRVAQGCHQAKGAVAAAQVNHTCTAQIGSNTGQQYPGADIQLLAGEYAGAVA